MELGGAGLGRMAPVLVPALVVAVPVLVLVLVLPLVPAPALLLKHGGALLCSPASSEAHSTRRASASAHSRRTKVAVVAGRA